MDSTTLRQDFLAQEQDQRNPASPSMKRRVGEEWTEERNTLLIDLRAAGTPRRKIAEIINEKTGSHFSKAAICGRIDRIFTVAKPQKTEAEKAASKQAQRERDRLKSQLRRSQDRQKRIDARLPVDMPKRMHIIRGNGSPSARRIFFSQDNKPPNLRCVGVVSFEKTSIELEPRHCRYPDGQPITFCGHDKIKGSSYCFQHHHLCHRPLDNPAKLFGGRI